MKKPARGSYKESKMIQTKKKDIARKEAAQEKTDSFKAYYVTCRLLELFEGVHAMVAEEELFLDTQDFINGKLSDKEYLDRLEFVFGLDKEHLDIALLGYKEYREEEEMLDGGINLLKPKIK